MKHNEDELQKELKELKITDSLDPQNKASMKAAIKKHAKKKRKRKKLKHTAIWASTAAALFLAGILVYSMIDSNQSVLPADDHDEAEHNNNTSEKQPAEHENEEDTNDEITDPAGFSVSKAGAETKTIMIEGMEEEVTVTNYTLEPYGIHYQMEDFLGNYNVDEQSVRHYSDWDNAWVRLEVAEDAAMEDVASNIQSEYNEDFSYTEEPTEIPQEENSYEGISQHFSDPPQGYIVYQIGEDVLVIQYEYDIEAGDGMGPRLQALRESIE